MKRMLRVVVLLTAVAGSAAAQDLPTVDQVLEKYVAAVGGKAAHQKLTSRLVKGTFEIPEMGGAGTIEISEKAPNKTLRTTVIDNFGTFRQGYNGTLGWADDPQQGLRDLSGEELALIKREADFHGRLDYRLRYKEMKVSGKEKLGDQDAYVVDAVTPEGRAEKLYFDAANGFLVRTILERDTPMGKLTITSSREDYREIDGIKLAFTLRIDNTRFTQVIKVKEVTHNVELDDKRFDKP